jgi:hypothetical protein
MHPTSLLSSLGAWTLVPPAVSLIVVLVTAGRAVRFLMKDRTTEDVHARIASAVRRAAGSGRLAGVAAGELSALYYGLFSWRARASVPPGHAAFSYRECDGHVATLTGLVALLALDTTLLHLLVAQHSRTVAWVLTVLGGYGVLWAVADHRAAALRPILVSPTGVLVRAGIRGTVLLPLASIEAVCAGSDAPADRRAYKRMTLVARPDFVVQLSAPVAVQGLLGSSRKVTSVGLSVDEPADLAAALRRLGVPVGEVPERDRGDFVDRLREGLRGVVRRAPVADALARELALLTCAFFFWRLTPRATQSARAFTIHRKAGYGPVMATLIGISCIEMYVVDALVRSASATAANVLLAVGAYAIVWFFGDFQALRVRPIVLGDHVLFVRAGLRREARIPLADVEAIEAVPLAGEAKRDRDYLRCTAFGPAEIILRLRAPARFEQMMGRARDVVRVGLSIDDEAAFRGAVLAAAERARQNESFSSRTHRGNH